MSWSIGGHQPVRLDAEQSKKSWDSWISQGSATSSASALHHAVWEKKNILWDFLCVFFVMVLLVFSRSHTKWVLIAVWSDFIITLQLRVPLNLFNVFSHGWILRNRKPNWAANASSLGDSRAKWTNKFFQMFYLSLKGNTCIITWQHLYWSSDLICPVSRDKVEKKNGGL